MLDKYLTICRKLYHYVSYYLFTEASASKLNSAASKLLIVPRDLPYLRQTNARRVCIKNLINYSDTYYK